ncbi:unnamed protein product [Arabidopsis thaliana]|uniref:Cysteine/Histidine-rich C1 domain family protein n=1 Tax=Arabidopsis thaliana TaxID=3702 RepID=A0A654FES8_ARATH|nr:unnamed protein product [Arabidopsis thaliana]
MAVVPGADVKVIFMEATVAMSWAVIRCSIRIALSPNPRSATIWVARRFPNPPLFRITRCMNIHLNLPEKQGFRDMTCLEVLLPPYKHHSSHPKHPLKNLKHGSPSYADKKCLLCGIKFQDERFNKVRNKCYPHKNVLELYHCDVCNVCICMSCEGNPPPLAVVSLTTHEHEVHLIPRLLDFTCNACGTQGDRSPYFCLQCNFMIHRDCIDLPRIININRHDHRLSYTSHLGHGNQKCGVCRKAVDGCCGAYSCKKCPSYVVHSLCATRKDVWDMVELEGIPEEEEIAPFKVIDENTIKHMSHDHDLILYMDGRILHESKLCEACVCQINTDPFYSCEQCGFILHQTCAIMPREKRHVLCNTPFTLQANDSKDSPRQRKTCLLCNQNFTGFGYQSRNGKVMDVRCGSIFEPFVHKSHPHPLFYKFCNNKCDACETTTFTHMLCCDECEFSLDFRCATLPRKVVKQRHDDRPLYLSYIDNNVDGGYWCDICEKKVVEDGYEFFADRQLVTMFSAPNYCGEFDNAGALMSVDESLMCSFQILKPVDRSVVARLSSYKFTNLLLQSFLSYNPDSNLMGRMGGEKATTDVGVG